VPVIHPVKQTIHSKKIKDIGFFPRLGIQQDFNKIADEFIVTKGTKFKKLQRRTFFEPVSLVGKPSVIGELGSLKGDKFKVLKKGAPVGSKLAGDVGSVEGVKELQEKLKTSSDENKRLIEKNRELKNENDEISEKLTKQQTIVNNELQRARQEKQNKLETYFLTITLNSSSKLITSGMIDSRGLFSIWVELK